MSIAIAVPGTAPAAGRRVGPAAARPGPDAGACDLGTTRRSSVPSYPWRRTLPPAGTAREKVYASAEAALDVLLVISSMVALNAAYDTLRDRIEGVPA